MTPVGAFENPAPGGEPIRLSSCTPNSNIGVTHNNPTRTDLTGPFSFNWTAPVSETGPVQFLYTTVQVRDFYWVAEQSAVIQERKLSHVLYTL